MKPDHDLEAERAILGSILLRSEAFNECEFLEPRDFYLPKHAAIFTAIAWAHADVGVTDPVTVASHLRTQYGWDDSTYDFLVDLVHGVVATVIGHLSTRVRRHAKNRRAVVIAHEIQRRSQAGADLEDLIDQLLDEQRDDVEANENPTRSWMDLLSAPPVEWVIKSLVARDSIVMLAAASTSGKSLVALSWAYSLICGKTWFGCNVMPGHVLYLCGEGEGGIGGRLRAIIAANPSEKPTHALEFVMSMPKLSTQSGCNDLERLVAAMARKHGCAPLLVVIDTLSQAFGDGDENDASTVAPAIRALAEIRRKFGCSILILHHITKASEKLTLNSVRGSGAFTANVDIVLGIDQMDDTRTIRVLKIKDGEVGKPISFDIRGQETGRVLQGGWRETAPIIVPTKPRDDERPSPHTVEQKILAVIEQATTEGLTRRQIEEYTQLATFVVFEAMSRLATEQTVVKTGGNTPRYYVPQYAPSKE